MSERDLAGVDLMPGTRPWRTASSGNGTPLSARWSSVSSYRMTPADEGADQARSSRLRYAHQVLLVDSTPIALKHLAIVGTFIGSQDALSGLDQQIDRHLHAGPGVHRVPPRERIWPEMQFALDGARLPLPVPIGKPHSECGSADFSTRSPELMPLNLGTNGFTLMASATSATRLAASERPTLRLMARQQPGREGSATHCR